VYLSFLNAFYLNLLFKELGARCDQDQILRLAEHGRKKYHPEHADLIAAALRGGSLPCFDGSKKDLFNRLLKSDKVQVWLNVFEELYTCGSMRHPTSGDTLLHLVVKSEHLSTEEKLWILERISDFCINPFVPNIENETVASLVRGNKELTNWVREYSQWRPVRKVNFWFGRYFFKRMLAMLASIKQYGVSKDVRRLLCKYLSETEYIYAPL
jgi:hypothetical protein